MNDLLAIGASGIRAYRSSLAAVSDNIANAQTPGYARRTVRLEEVTITSPPDYRYRNRTRFDGVDVSATVRMIDAWRTADARTAATSNARAEATATWALATETALSNSDAGTGASLARMFASGDALAADPASRAPRAAFLSTVDEAASAIRTSAGELSRVAGAVADAGQSAVTSLNADLATLAEVNLAIRRTGAGTTANAELADQRDGLIDRITQKLDMTVNLAADGSTTLTRGAATLLIDGTAATISQTVGPDGRLSFAVNGTAMTPANGALAGIATSASTVADRRASLDVLATDLASALNTWHAGGRAVANAGGAALLDASGGAIALAALVTDPDAVAAADASGVANGNALALSSVRSGSGVEAQWAALVSTQAQTTSAAQTARAATAARSETADAARDQVEGVDLDREAADLLRFQQAYEASARVIQMAKETVDTILRMFG